MDETLDMFAAIAQRDEAIARADSTVARAVGGDELVGRVTNRIIKTYGAGMTFSVDEVDLMLDDMQVPKDGETRRRITGTIINRGKGKLWTHDGFAVSRDPRRNARPVARWRRLDIHAQAEG